MNESGYLRRSLSQPTSCSREEEWDPLRCLSESASFGRFANEPLEWDRWSVFSQKRYLEEAERYSKPGSVAAKKAYFEAHFKKKAEERAKALLEASNLGNLINVVQNQAVDLKEEEQEQEQELSVTQEIVVPVEENKKTVNTDDDQKITDSEKQIKVILPASKQANIRSQNRTEKSLVKNSAKNKSEKSIHMSINFSSRPTKTASSNIIKTSLNLHMRVSDSLQIKAKATTGNGTSKRPQSQAISNLKPNHGKSSDSKSRSSVVSNPFSFRSEERAAKRKEFYERLEERRKADEAAKRQPMTKYRCVSAQPIAPKNERKPSSVRTMDKTRASQPLSIKKDQTVRQNVSSRCKNIAHENSSPNIQSSSFKY